ncbi:histidine kinase [Streptomyces sp. NPDC046557]|uniref:sensor histidine kinase n=1 Tax=Streptomyces sp. NPDC046557 TaxID=3155372 RepID=UPI0034016882
MTSTTTPTGAAAADPIWSQPLAAGMLRACRRLRQLDRRSPWLLDTGIVLAVLLLFGLPDLLHGQEGARPGPADDPALITMAALQLGLAVPLLWRRRHSTAAFAVIALVFTLQWSLDVRLHADIALFLALYSVARHDRLRRLPWVGAATVAVLLVMVVRVSEAVSYLVALFFLCCAATAATVLGLTVRIGFAYLGTLRERAARLEVERDQRSRLAAAAERARIAREMHDIIGHNLSVIIGLADGARYAADLAPQRSKEALHLIGGTGRQALGELRRMLGVLREEAPDTLQLSPQPGVADLDALCARVRAAGPDVVYRTIGDVEALGPGPQLAVYRIAQESLTNTLKHAGPHTTAHLTLSVRDGQVHLMIDDDGPQDGRARPLPDPGHGPGEGIAGMQERAALYQGHVDSRRRPGGGWRVEAVLDPAALTAPAGGTP